jgi:hypothetical protein
LDRANCAATRSNPPLFIDADAKFTAPVALERLEEIARKAAKSFIDVAASSRSSLICALRSNPENALIFLPFAKSCVRLFR